MANGNSNSRWGGLVESSSDRTLRAKLASSSAAQFRQALTIARQAGLRTDTSGQDARAAISRAAALGGAAGLTAEALAAAGLPSYYDSRRVQRDGSKAMIMHQPWRKRHGPSRHGVMAPSCGHVT